MGFNEHKDEFHFPLSYAWKVSQGKKGEKIAGHFKQ
jgi:hypothetical protein